MTGGASSTLGHPVQYLFDWGDGNTSGWIGPFASGQEIIVNYKWSNLGTYTISCKAKDIYGAESNWSEWSLNSIKIKPQKNGTAIVHSKYLNREDKKIITNELKSKRRNCKVFL
jgi:hypothetical protein